MEPFPANVGTVGPTRALQVITRKSSVRPIMGALAETSQAKRIPEKVESNVGGRLKRGLPHFPVTSSDCECSRRD